MKMNKPHTRLPSQWFLVKGKIRLPKMEHPKFESHVKPNKDEYKKSTWLKFRYCLEVS